MSAPIPITLSGLKSLSPYKELAEQALDGRPVVGYSKTLALEIIGETDPTLILEEARQEKPASIMA